MGNTEKPLRLKLSVTRGEYPQEQPPAKDHTLFCDRVLIVPMIDTTADGYTTAVVGYDGATDSKDGNAQTPVGSTHSGVLTAWAALTHNLSTDMNLPWEIREALDKSCTLVTHVAEHGKVPGEPEPSHGYEH